MGVSLITWLIMSTSQTKNKVTAICETDQIAQTASCYLTGTYVLKAARPQIPDLWLHDHPFREFFIGGV